MKTFFTRILALALCCACILSVAGTSLADTYTTTINFPADKAVYGPGGTNYHQKGNSNQKWSATYTNGWNASTSAYLYDQQYGDRATHIEPFTRGTARTGLEYLGTNCCQSSHKYKIVVKRDISQYSGAYTFKYTWTM